MKRWQCVALAAAISGFFLLRGQSASAEIIYRANGVHSVLISSALDLDGDGTTDFRFSSSTYPYYTDLTHQLLGYFRLSTVSGNTGNSAIGYDMMIAYEDPVAIPLGAGELIGPDSRFATDMNRGLKGPMVLGGYDPVVGGGGLYGYYTDRPYLGVRFLINGQSHYGWLRIGVSANDVAVYEGAYETVIGHGIAAGEVPEPLALPPAAGAIILIASSWRRRKTDTRSEAGPPATRSRMRPTRSRMRTRPSFTEVGRNGQ